jgi:PAS domain S-box-containing protein
MLTAAKADRGQISRVDLTLSPVRQTGNGSHSILLERFELRRFFPWPVREHSGARQNARVPSGAGAEIQVLKSLQERERTLRNLLEGLPAAVCATDADGRITFYNQAAVEIWGQRPELGTTKWCGSWKLYWPDGRPMPHDESPMAIALKENRRVRGIEAIAERPDSSRVSFCLYPTPLHDDAGRLVGAMNVLVDITPHKEAEERLKLPVSDDRSDLASARACWRRRSVILAAIFASSGGERG